MVKLNEALIKMTSNSIVVTSSKVHIQLKKEGKDWIVQNIEIEEDSSEDNVTIKKKPIEFTTFR